MGNPVDYTGDDPTPVTQTGEDMKLTLLDGEAVLDLEYEVQIKNLHEQNALWRRVYLGPETHCSIPDLDQEQLYSLRVRAITGNSVKGQWTLLEGIMTDKDRVPPPIPSKPTVKGDLGVVIVTWDGMGSASEEMPPDFDRVEIGISTTLDGEIKAVPPALDLATLSMPIEEGSFDAPIWIRLRSVDKLGNESEWSEPEVCELKKLVDVEAIQKLINGALKTRSDVKPPNYPTNPEDKGSEIGEIWWEREIISVTNPDGTVTTEIGKPVKAYRWDGIAWQPETFHNATFGRVDIADLVADKASVQDLVAQRLAAAVGRFITIEADQINANNVTAMQVLAGRLKAYILDVDWLRGKTIDSVTLNSARINSPDINGGTITGSRYRVGDYSTGYTEISTSGFKVTDRQGNPVMQINNFSELETARIEVGIPGRAYKQVIISPAGPTGYLDGYSNESTIGFIDDTYGTIRSGTGAGISYIGNRTLSLYRDIQTRDINATGGVWVGAVPSNATVDAGWSNSRLGYMGSERCLKNIDRYVKPEEARKIFGLKPMLFRYNDTVEAEKAAKENDSTAPDALEMYGLLAEQVANVMPEMAFYRQGPLSIDYPEYEYEVGKAGGRQPAGVHYKLLAVPLITITKDHEDRINKLEAQVAELQTRLAKLESEAA